MAKFKLIEGDIFTIPLGNGEYGFGQIVSFPRSKDVFIMCVFETKQSDIEKVNIEEIIRSQILFLGYSTDAKLYHKDWIIIGNSINNLSKIVLPYHKLGLPTNTSYIVNYKGERLKELSEDTFSELEYLTNYSPIRYENALKAHYGLQEWKEEDYDKLLYKHAIASKKIFEKVMLNHHPNN